MCRLENVATPATAVTGFGAPVSLAFLETLPSVPSAARTGPVKFVATFPSESYAVTCTGGLIALSCMVALGCTVNASSVAGARLTPNAPLGLGGNCGRHPRVRDHPGDRESTRLNARPLVISHVAFCFEKKKKAHD